MTALVAATFLVALLVILASYWFFVVRPESRDKVSLVARLNGVRQRVSSISVTKAPQRLSAIPAFESVLARRRTVVEPLQQLLVESGVRMTVGAFVLATFVAAAAAAVFGWFVLHLLVVAVGLAVLASMLPLLYVRFKRTRRLQLFEEQFPEAIDLIARALRAGHALTTGLGMVAEEVPAPVGEEFKRLYDEQNYGMSLPDAMRAMARRVPVLDARFFVTAVLTQREAGGNLSEVLDNLASVMRERFKLKRQIRVASAHGRISAWVLACLPPALAAVLFILSPNFMKILWEDPWGVQLLLIAATLQVIGSVIISRLVKIEY